MSDQVLRKLLVSIGFRVDDGQVAKADQRTRQATRSADAMEGAFRKAAAALAAVGVASKALESIKANLDFEKQLGKLQTLVPENIAQVQNYRQELLDMSQRTGKGLGELADATYEVGSAFGVTADTLAITEFAAKAATAAGAETKEAVDLISAVTMAYGDTTMDAIKHTGDLAAMTANIGKTSIPEMAAGIGQLTGTAKKLGIEQEELFAIIATGSGVIGPTAQMMTGFDAVMSSLIKPTTEMRKVYKRLGITAIENEVAQQGLVPTLQRLTKATHGNLDATGKLFNSKEAMAVVLPIVSNLNKDYRDKLMQLTKSEGSAAKAYDASTQGLAANAHAAELAEAKMTALKVMVGERLTPSYVEFLDLMLKVSGTFQTADQDSQRLTSNLEGHLRTLGEFKTTIGAIIKFLMSPIIAVTKLVDHLLLALKAVSTFAKDMSWENAGNIGKELGLSAVHGFSAAALGTPEMLNQMFGGANSEIASALGFDSRGIVDPRMALLAVPGLNAAAGASMWADGMGGLRGALFADINAMRASTANKEIAGALTNWANNLSIGNLVVNTTGLPAQQAEQAANAIPESILARVFKRAEGVLAPPKVAQ